MRAMQPKPLRNAANRSLQAIRHTGAIDANLGYLDPLSMTNDGG